MRNVLSIFILAILIASCGLKQADENYASSWNSKTAVAGMDEDIITESESAPGEPPLPVDEIESQEVIKKKIIKDGRLGLHVSELERTKSRVDSLMKSNGGYYANERFNNSDWESSYILKIRIPSVNFEKFISGIETGEGEVLYKEIDARDVTDQFIDLETRLENKRNYLTRYNDLLKKANSIKEILEIEEKIRGLEEEIESTTGRLKYLSDLVKYSTLDLTISKPKDFKYSPTRRDNFSERLKQSVSKGWFGFVDFTLFLIKIWPFWIIAALIMYFWRRYRRRKKKKS